MTDRNKIMNMVRSLANRMHLMSDLYAEECFADIRNEIALLETQNPTTVIVNQYQVEQLGRTWGELDDFYEGQLALFNQGDDLCVYDPEYPDEGYVIIPEHEMSESQAFDDMIYFLTNDETKTFQEINLGDVRETGEICLLWEVCKDTEA